MSLPREPAPPRLSTGAELEFAVVYVFNVPNVFSSTPEKVIDDDLPEPLNIPYPFGQECDLDRVGQRAVETAIRLTLKEAGFLTDAMEIKSTDSIPIQRLGPYRHWQVAKDGSVAAEGLQKIKTMQPLRLRAAQIEIQTPVEWDSPLSFEVVRYAVNLLASKFRIQVNPSMGLHVHVGDGASWMSHQWVKRMACLFWAAERLLSTLNPPTRSYNYYCPSIRDYSPLARNEHHDELLPHDEAAFSSWMSDGPLYCGSYLARDVRPGESSLLWRETHAHDETVDAFMKTRRERHFEPFYEENALQTDGVGLDTVEDPRVTLDQYTVGSTAVASCASSGRPSPEPIDDTLSVPLKSTQLQLACRIAELEPMKEILGLKRRLNGFPRLKLPKWTREQLRDIDQINAGLTGHGMVEWLDQEQDPGVWFGVQQISRTDTSCEISQMLRCHYRANYNLRDYDCGTIGYLGSGSKRTIEWRQGAGSMDALWISTWMRIVVGVSRFAVNAPVDEFLHIIRCCDYAEKGGSYDVLDFLESLGLVAEALIAGTRIENYGENWGLEYEDPSGE